MIRFGIVRTGTGATTQCVRCPREPYGGHDSAEEILARVQHAVAEWPDGPGPNISLRGPEPLGHPEIERIINETIGFGVERLSLVTNGVDLAHRGTAEGVATARVTHLQLVILAADAHSHDVLTGSPGSFDSAMTGLRVFREVCDSLGVPYMLCGEVPVCSHNVEHMPGIVGLLAQNGVRSVALDLSRAPASQNTEMWVEAALDT
ncbi:MAG: radical SAM protein, partial [Coriobacteriia bacterium]|nr:radical SAM protein [Coriobacteriia bacterium]